MISQEKLIYRDNFLLTRDFLSYLKSKRKNPKTIRRYQSWLGHALLWAMDIPFEKAHTVKTPFVQYVEDLGLAQESQKKIIETFRVMLRYAKLYFEKRFIRLPYYWIEDLTPPKGKRSNICNYVRVDEIRKIMALNIDRTNIALWRDQAMACMLFLSGARAEAATTLPIKCVHLNARYPYIEQDPELGVRTKNDKSAITYLHIIPELLEFVREWDDFARRHYPEDHPWYTPIHQVWGEQTTRRLIPGKNRSQALAKRLRILNGLTGTAYKSPHKYRHGYAVYGLERCKTMAQYHNLSRNLMHSSIAITDQIYVNFDAEERGRILSGIYENPVLQPDHDLMAHINKLGQQDLLDNIILIAQRLANMRDGAGTGDGAHH